MTFQRSSCTAVLASAFLIAAGASNGQTQGNQHQQASGQNFYITTPQTGQRTSVNTGATATQQTANTYIAETAWSKPAASTAKATTRQVSNRRTQQATQQAQPNYYANTTAQQAAHNYYATSQQSQRSTQQYSTNQQAAEQTIYPAAYVSNASTGKKGLFNRLLHRDHDHPHETKAASSPVQAAKNMAYSASKMAGTMQQGVASWYGGKWHGRKTASGERYNQESMTAAHKTLPFGTVVKVTNERNGRECMVRINNRGPFTKGRILDLSKAAARHLGIIGSGVAKVKMEVVGKS